MKKRTAMIMALVMTASTMFAGTAFAEAEAEEAAAEAVELSWDMVADKAAEVEGDFVTFDEIAVKIWVPAEMQAVELTEEDVENGYIGYYSNEEKGWNIYTNRNKNFYADPFEVTPVDTTGCGDNFTAGFIHAYLKGMTDEACLQFASAAGALNSLGLGASSYIRSEEMVLEFIRKTRQKHIAH